MARYMTSEECCGNWNYMYEWRSPNTDEWFPCHLYDMESLLRDGVCIFTRNGTIMSVKNCDVRKMSKETYIKNREYGIEAVREYYNIVGFHSNLEDDLKLWETA